MKKIIQCIMLVTMLVCPVLLFAAADRHINVAAFQRLATTPNFEFDPIVLGKFSSFISAMEDGSQVLFLAHTANLNDGDVISLQLDALGEVDGASIADHGINCTFSFHDESDSDTTMYNIGGMCHILMLGAGGGKKIRAIIPVSTLPDTSQGVDAWVQIHEDEETGTAFYANFSSK
ncbi:MAG: hypothetical protein R8K21_05330 [Mariprofundales bacterium]